MIVISVLAVKCSYTARRPSVSSVASSGPGTEDVQPPLPVADPVVVPPVADPVVVPTAALRSPDTEGRGVSGLALSLHRNVAPLTSDPVAVPAASHHSQDVEGRGVSSFALSLHRNLSPFSSRKVSVSAATLHTPLVEGRGVSFLACPCTRTFHFSLAPKGGQTLLMSVSPPPPAPLSGISPPPVWNLRAVIGFHFSLLLLLA